MDSPLTIVSLSAGKVNRTLTTETEKRERRVVYFNSTINLCLGTLAKMEDEEVHQSNKHKNKKPKDCFKEKTQCFHQKRNQLFPFFGLKSFQTFKVNFVFLETRTSMLRSFFVFLCAGLVWLPYLIANSDLLIVVIEDSTSFDISAPCFIFSGGRYKCTNSKNWDGGERTIS